jgi:predicted Zn finger-like uncharacterized protein
MTIPATCPACGATYQLDEGQRGQRVRCRACDGTFEVGAPDRPRRREPDDPHRRRRDRRDRDPEPAPRSDTQVLLWVLGGIGAGLLLVGLACAGLIWMITVRVGQAVDETVAQVKKMQPPAHPGDPKGTDEALKWLGTPDRGKQRSAALWLAQQQPDPKRRAEVLAALEPLRNDPDIHVRVAAINAHVRWSEP